MALKFPATTEMTPMISPERVERITTNGTLELEGNFQKGDFNSRRGWLSAKFNHIYCILFILSLVMLAILVLCIILAVRLGSMESFYEKTTQDVPQIVADLIAKIQKPQLSNVALAPLLPLSASIPDGTPILPEVVRSNTSKKSYEEEHQLGSRTCDQVGQCKKKEFLHPPLVILSLDGFSSAYIDRGIVRSFQSFIECGASADSVLPSYPSRTFPNHYTMVTGLYPESHGIVDNNVFDPSISPYLENMKSTQFDAFWGGDPIWSVYKRQTGGRTACLFWPGCGYNSSGYPPDISLKYNKDLPFRNRFDIILDWLKLPSEERPGLITAYLDQPDSIGHYQKEDSDVTRENRERLI
uniref:Ectonucleotide pyrophosphatase/phosphodiesterase family member 3 n=1 Tax=Heterorhabditis bacteriophora TaxID=37862 RepID=A0A1I7XLR5_HETBA